jgi:hypothetical protein
MYLGNRDQIELARSMMEEQLDEAAFIEAAAQCGYPPAALQHLFEEVVEWSRRPDFFWAMMMCHALAWAL